MAIGNVVFWSISSFKTKSEHLTQFFWWEINLRELRGFILQKIWALVAGRQKKKFCHWSLDLGRKKLLWYSCQLEIDHVTQKSKETCQSTCGGAKTTDRKNENNNCLNELKFSEVSRKPFQADAESFRHLSCKTKTFYF